MMEVVAMPTDFDPALNARSVADFEDISIPTLNRRIREGTFPPADYCHGAYRFWLRSSVLAARERRLAENPGKLAHHRQAQLDAADRARAAQREKRALASS
jgi:hypothetical protein